MPGAYCDPCRCYRNEVRATQDNVHMRYVHMRYSNCCPCYTAAAAAVAAAAVVAVAAAAPAAAAAIAAAPAPAAAVVPLLLLPSPQPPLPSPACAMLHAMLHAMLYAQALGALGSSGSCVARMWVRAQGKGRVLLAGSLGPIALVLTCTAESMMTNLMRESSS